MSGFGAFMKKEALGTRRTWRLWVLPGVLVFCGLTSPATAKLLPFIAKSAAKSSHGAVISLPPPVALDAYTQFLGNLAQLALLVILVSCGGLISSELKSGTGVLVLAKPLPRWAFIAAKTAMQIALTVAATVMATLVCLAITAALFGHVDPAGRLVGAVGVWLIYATLFTVVMVCLSTVMGSQAGAAGTGFGVFLSFAVLDALPVLSRFTPIGLSSLPAHVLEGKPAAMFWPIVTSVLLTIVAGALAVRAFTAKEI